MPRFGYIAEGVVTAKWVNAIAAQRKLSLPIIGGVYRILNREVDPLAEAAEHAGAHHQPVDGREALARAVRSPAWYR